MKHRTGSRDWTPLAKGGARTADLPTGEAFQTEWIDFARGIRVGHLEPHERITQILKFYLDKENGDLRRALGRYNGSLGRRKYPNKVIEKLSGKWFQG